MFFKFSRANQHVHAVDMLNDVNKNKSINQVLHNWGIGTVGACVGAKANTLL